MGRRSTAARAIGPVLLCASLALSACGTDARPEERDVEIVDTGCAGPSASPRPYSVGTAFAGLPLRTVLLQCDGRAGDTSDTISYIYGDCTPPAGEGGCAPPLEVQTWHACARTYRDSAPGNRSSLSRRRGVPIADSGGQIEVYSDSTVVIFASDPALARRAVSALRPTPRGDDPARPPAEPPRGDLPQPSPGALDKAPGCGRVG